MKKTLSFRVLAIALCVAMLATVTPIFASAESVTYLDYNATTGKVDTERLAANVNVIDETTDSFVTGWNVVTGSVEFENRITLPANVNLILADGATLTAKKGITVAEDGDFAVYAQSSDADTMGQLIVPEREENYDAGIGCLEKESCGNITVYGGMLTVQGGYNSAGIGCADHGTCGIITIYDGVVTAEGANHGVGIGAGSYGSCGEVTIAGGTVTAESASHGAGIGSGSYGSCGEVTIAGGIVTANGGKLGAGIGSGFGGSCTKVTVSGGYVKATAGESADSIGTGYSCEAAVPVSIDDSCVSLTKDGSQYINYEPFAAVKTTCTAVGALAYVKDYVSGNYYTAFPFTEDGLIGNEDALAAWKAEGGDGYVEKLPHADNNEDDRCDGCGAVHATYLDYNETTGKVDTEREVWGVNVIYNPSSKFVPGWNMVKGSVEFENRITLPANINLILENGATLTAKKGIAVNSIGAFSIYAQSNDAATMGQLIVPGADDYKAGIGNSGGYSTCDDIVIYGGIVTTCGGDNAAGIGGGGPNSTCGNITVYGGIVTAQGGGGAAGIGNGYNNSSCGDITISGGYVKATAGNSANPIGAGHESSCGTVSINSSCTSVTDGSTRYINYLTPALDPTCTESGFAAYYIDPVSNTYYTALSFEQDKLIGDAAALAAWKAEGGGGYVPPLGHDWQFVDETIHQCARCETTAAHTGADDFVCDDCGGILLETAIAVTKAQGEAKAALTAAMGEKPSETLATILSDACAAVDAAITLDDVATAKADGLTAIADQKTAELEARKAQILPECEMLLASDESSAMVKSMVREFVASLNAAETLRDVEFAMDRYAPAIRLRMARDTWIPQIEELLPEEPSDAIKAIIDDACDLILNCEDMAVFSYVLDITRLAVERQLAAEATQELLEQTENDLTAANVSIDELNNTIASKDATIAEKQAALDAATEQLNTAKSDLETAKANLETAKANIEELEGTVSEQDEALKQAAQDLEDKQAALDEMTEKYNTASAALDELKKALDEANAANEKAKQDLAAANEALKTANEAITALNEAIASKDATIAEKLAAVDAAQKALDDAKAKVTELEGTVSEQDEALKQAKQDIQDLQAEIDRLKALLDNDPTDPPPVETIGDANGDGAVNMKDVLLLRKYLADTADTMNMENADVNADGDVNMKDVLLLRKYLAGVVENLGA